MTTQTQKHDQEESKMLAQLACEHLRRATKLSCAGSKSSIIGHHLREAEGYACLVPAEHYNLLSHYNYLLSITHWSVMALIRA